MNLYERLSTTLLTSLLVGLPIVVVSATHKPNPRNLHLEPATEGIRPAVFEIGHYDPISTVFSTARTTFVIAVDPGQEPVYYLLTARYPDDRTQAAVKFGTQSTLRDRPNPRPRSISPDVPHDHVVYAQPLSHTDELTLLRLDLNSFRPGIVPISKSPDTSELFSLIFIDDLPRKISGTPLLDDSNQQSLFRLNTSPHHDAGGTAKGAPLIDKNGFLVGVYMGRSKDFNHRDIHHYIPLKPIRELLAQQGIADLISKPDFTVLSHHSQQSASASRLHRISADTPFLEY